MYFKKDVAVIPDYLSNANYNPFIWAYHKKDDPPVVIEPLPEKETESFPPKDDAKKPKKDLESLIIIKKD